MHSQPVRVLRVRPAALGRSPEIPRSSRPFARDAAGRVTGRDPVSQGTRPERAIFSVGRFRGHTTSIDGRGIARRCCLVLENQRDCRGVAAVTGYRSTSSGAVDLRLFEAERLSLSRPIEGLWLVKISYTAETLAIRPSAGQPLGHAKDAHPASRSPSASA